MFFRLICIGVIFHSVNHAVVASTPEFNEDSKEDFTENIKEDFKNDSTTDMKALGRGPCTGIMDEAINILERAIECAGKQSCPRVPPISEKPMDCAEILYENPYAKSGVYTVWIRMTFSNESDIQVYCDMDDDGGGWTVIQRRGDFGSPPLNFWRKWADYKTGFGDREKEFWLGNDNIFALTNQKLTSLKFELTDWDNVKKFAIYDGFWIDDEIHKYTAHVIGYRGDAGDSFATANNVSFSTKDRDNDQSSLNCASTYKGAWWYPNCGNNNLNAIRYKAPRAPAGDGMNWYHFRGYHYSLKDAAMKIRPKAFKRPGIHNN